ncbi:hypothetical protein M407DRAFT_26369 [Tulasnella calospora MUT 4182]|uniref:BTB domain-containing protein n=1 Tax=Tulasnella calospora MUT 4182 TaxID=1051891 RepID=A0A0C3Q577_9AGAM|nr:hypothetical protein M407DRAFT_26369 [Tulasnella calospora MUT 4182]
MTTPSTSSFLVQPPFDAESFGDCIIQASDGAEFKGLRAILGMASCIFRDMFDMPPPPSNTAENTGMGDVTPLPVIPVAEDAETLQAMLQMIYPLAPPRIQSITLAHKLATACAKYFIDTAKVQLHVHAILNKNDSLEMDAVGCYTLAWKLGMEQEAIAASRYFCPLDVGNKTIAKRIVTESGDLEALLALWDLRVRTDKALDDLLALAPISVDMACDSHPWSSGTSGAYSRRKEGLGQRMAAPTPVCDDIEAFLAFQVGSGPTNCPACAKTRSARLDEARTAVRVALKAYPRTIKGLS